MSIYEVPKIPKDRDFEDYASAYIQLSGVFLERGIVYRESGEEFLEMDIVTTKLTSSEKKVEVVEIKSGKWGFSDVFKVAGWIEYLKMNHGVFIVQKNDKISEIAKKVANEINIELLLDHKIDGEEIISYYIIDNSKEWFGPAVNTLRYSYAVEHGMLDYLQKLSKSCPSKVGYGKLWDFIFHMCNNTFFENDPIKRTTKLFELFKENQNITAKLANECDKGFPNDCKKIPTNIYKEIFMGLPKKMVYHSSLYSELQNRLLILKTTVEYSILGRRKTEGGFDEVFARMEESGMPNNVKNAAKKFKGQQYFHLYPYFWQVFVYLFGGFILTDKKECEYRVLSEITKIPLNHIKEAFNAFDVLFPLPENRSWMTTIGPSNIEKMQLFPEPFSGVGVYFRKCLYANGTDDSWGNLEKQLNGTYTMEDMHRWNNIACEYLDKYKIK